MISFSYLTHLGRQTYINDEFVIFWKAVCDKEIVSTDLSGAHYSEIDSAKWLPGLHRLYVRDCYHKLSELFLDVGVKNALLLGTPGIGKSLYLRWLIAVLARKAIATKEDGVTFRISFHERNDVVDYLCSLDGTVSAFSKDAPTPTYYFSDSVDIDKVDLSTKLTLLVSSDDAKQYDEWSKRLKENRKKSIIKFMPVFSAEELKCIAPEDADYQFRFDIVGGNAREAFAGGIERKDLMSFVEKQFEVFFDGIDVSTTEKQWAVLVVSTALGNTIDKKSSSTAIADFVVNSFFKCIQVDETYASVRHQWSSTFLMFLAGAINDGKDNGMLGQLKSVLGGSGYGNLFEYSGHKLLFENGAEAVPLLNCKTRIPTSLKFNFAKKALIRTIDDISSLAGDSYGLPSTCNFPMGDAFIKNPKTIFQFTSGQTHKGAVGKLPDICINLGGGDINVVYVVPQENLASFKPETIEGNLNITQYVTTLPKPVNEKALLAINTGEKRKDRP